LKLKDPASIEAPQQASITCLGAQYFLMKALMMGGLMTLLGVMGTL